MMRQDQLRGSERVYPVEVVFQPSAPRVRFLVRSHHAFSSGQLVFSFQLLDSVHAVKTQERAKVSTQVEEIFTPQNCC